MKDAVYYGDFLAINWLLSSGVDVNARVSSGLTALMLAIKYGRNQVVGRLMAEGGIDVNAKSSKGCTALMLASEKNNFDIVHKLLLVDGINVNAASNDGYTALMFASQDGHVEVVRKLLAENSINVNVKGEVGVTALILAAKYGHAGVVNQLLEVDGIDLNAKNSDGSSALNLAFQYGHIGVAKRLMLANGIDLGSRGEHGYTPLIFAAKSGEDNLVKYLLTQGVDVSARNSQNCTALMFAAQDGFADIVRQLLLVKGINLNVRDEDGNTALILAAKYGYIDIVKLLVSRLTPADVILNDNQGRNVYSLASTEIIKKYLICSGKLLFSHFGSPSLVVIPAWAFFGPGAAIFNQGALSIRARFLVLRVCGIEFPEAGTASNAGMIIEKFKVISALMRSAVLAKVVGGANAYFFMNMLLLQGNKGSIFESMGFDFKNNILGFLGEGELGCISPWVDVVNRLRNNLGGSGKVVPVNSPVIAENDVVARPAKAARK